MAGLLLGFLLLGGLLATTPTLSEALKELGGAVPVVPEPLIVLLVLVTKVVVLLLVNGPATEGAGGPQCFSGRHVWSLEWDPHGPVSQSGAVHVNIILAMLEMLMVFCLAHRLFTSKSLLIIRYEQTKLSFQ